MNRRLDEAVAAGRAKSLASVWPSSLEDSLPSSVISLWPHRAVMIGLEAGVEWQNYFGVLCIVIQFSSIMITWAAQPAEAILFGVGPRGALPR